MFSEPRDGRLLPVLWCLPVYRPSVDIRCHNIGTDCFDTYSGNYLVCNESLSSVETQTKFPGVPLFQQKKSHGLQDALHAFHDSHLVNSRLLPLATKPWPSFCSVLQIFVLRT